MKIVCISRNIYKAYINKYYYQYDKETINKCISKILLFLKKNYNVEIYSIFNIKCYINNAYGIILEIEREYDPFSLFSKNTNLKIEFCDNPIFLYKIDDYFISNDKKYIYKNNYYINATDKMDVIEHISEVIYGDIVKVIIDH